MTDEAERMSEEELDRLERLAAFYGEEVYPHPYPKNIEGWRMMARDIRAALAQARRPSASGSAGVPEGWKLVLVEPTDDQLDKGQHVNSEWLNDNAPIGERMYRDPAKAVYAAMLAASPPPPEGVGGGAEDAFDNLVAIVQYRRTHGHGGWASMAAFDTRTVADAYAKDCAGTSPERPWEYRVIDVPAPSTPRSQDNAG